MDDFQDQVRTSFKACRNDIENLKTENSVLRDRFFLVEYENKTLKEENKNLIENLNELKAEIKGIKLALDYIKEYNGAREVEEVRIGRVEDGRTRGLVDEKKEIRVETVSNQKKVSQVSQDPYEALLAFKAKANKRNLLKQKIMSMIGEQGMNLSELKFMFVEHFRYCSKASFYNYLKELEIERQVKVERENSKNYIYLMDMRKEI